MKIKLLFVLILTSIYSFAQFDLAKEIEAIVDTNEVIVRNGRAEIVKRLHAQQYSTIITIIEKVKTDSDSKDYIFVFPREEQLLSILALDMEHFLKVSREYSMSINGIQPPDDELFSLSVDVYMQTRDYYFEWVSQLELSEEDRQIVNLYFAFLDHDQKKIKTYNGCKRFDKRFPDSEYRNFIYDIKGEFVSATWEVELGYGYLDLDGELTELISTASTLSFGTGISYNRGIYSFFINGTLGSELNADRIGYADGFDPILYTKGSNVIGINVGIKTGWLLINQNRFRLYPYSLISGFSFTKGESYEDEEEDISFVLNRTFGAGVGLGFDYGIYNWSGASFIDNVKTNNHLGIKANINYQYFITNNKHNPGRGVYYNVSLVWWLGN